MRIPSLLLALALLVPVARAQTGPDQAALLADIDTWRHAQLVHVSPPAPLTVEFEPRLDAIEAAVKAAQGPEALAQPRKDFKTWQHDLLMKKFVATKREGVTRGTLDNYSKIQRDRMRTITAQTDQISQARLTQTPPELFDGGAANADAVGADATRGPDPAAVISAARFPGLHINPVATPPAVTSTPLSLASLWNYIDQSRGYKIAEAVFERATGFAGYCYASVKEGFIAAKDKLWAMIKEPTDSGRIGIPPGLAVDYQRAVNANPALLAKLGYRRVDVSTVPGEDPAVIPSGTILDFKPRCAGYSREAGHIEIIGARSMLDDIPRSARPTLASNQVLACSDGCHGRTLNYLRTYGRQACMSMYVPVKDVAAN